MRNQQLILYVVVGILILFLLYALSKSGTTFRNDPVYPVPKSVAGEVAAATNSERSKNGGRTQLQYDDALAAIAQAHSEDMARRGYFDHDTPEGISPFQRARNAKYPRFASAENIAKTGTSSAQQVVTLWMNSPGHRANILGDHKYVGIGVAKDVQGLYLWTQMFSS